MSLSRANTQVPPGTDQGYPAFGRDSSVFPPVLVPIKVSSDGTVATSGGGGGGGAVTITPNSSLSPGVKTVALAATPEALTAGAISGVLIQALRTNTSFVSVGNGSAQVIVLYPLDWVFLFTNNFSDVTIDVDVDGEGVAFIGYVA